MEILKAIRTYFKPVQPSVKATSVGITYDEIMPDIELASFIYCFWELKTQKTLEKEYVYRVVSDGCIDIFFEASQPSQNFIMGFCRRYTEFPLGKTFHFVGIRFLPAAFPLLFGINAKMLSNKSQDLKNILPDFSQWLSLNISSCTSFENVINTLHLKLTSIAESKSFNYDERFFKALKLILLNQGNLNIERFLDTGLSARQLRRIFNFYIGTTAKTFSTVIRFQHVLNYASSGQNLKNNNFYLDMGFFDQAHFIKDFKRFYGIKPLEAFN